MVQSGDADRAEAIGAAAMRHLQRRGINPVMVMMGIDGDVLVIARVDGREDAC